jgi:tetratricopeptide (TPR) repeat protein
LTTLAIHGLAAADDPAQLLVRYDFDQDTVETGPYTLMVFENSQGSVELTDAYRYSGFRAVEIRDVAGDGDFAELQGYFPERTTGKLFVHFALMTAAPEERFNVAFAGPSHFTMREHGIAFWLKNVDGVLHHVSAGEDRPLFELSTFTWYTFELAYDIDNGIYDLAVYEERQTEPLLALAEQPNTVAQPGSSVHKFSFIGDIPGVDDSNAHFYIDDIEIRSDRAARQGPFVAPGRRMLFVDIWDYYQKKMYERPGCPPVLSHDDFGLSPRDLYDLSRTGTLKAVEALLDGREASRPPADLESHLESLFEGLRLWQRGCEVRQKCDSNCRAALLERAEAAIPYAKLPPMCRVMALAGAKRWTEADELFVSIYPDWQNDPRFPAISAVLGLARGQTVQAEEELLAVPEELTSDSPHPLLRRLWSGQLNRDLAGELESVFGDRWTKYVEAALVVEHRYYVFLWQERYDEAELYAERMVRRLRRLDLPVGRWLERQGDAAFYAGDFVGALRSYEHALRIADNPTAVLLKLSDVHFKLGNIDDERAYREKVYGTLEPKWAQRDPEPGLRFDRCQTCPGNE